jgi:hypothetical protein
MSASACRVAPKNTTAGNALDANEPTDASTDKAPNEDGCLSRSPMRASSPGATCRRTNSQSECQWRSARAHLGSSAPPAETAACGPRADWPRRCCGVDRPSTATVAPWTELRPPARGGWNRHQAFPTTLWRWQDGIEAAATTASCARKRPHERRRLRNLKKAWVAIRPGSCLADRPSPTQIRTTAARRARPFFTIAIAR